MKYKAVVIGASAGGLDALSKLFGALPENFPLPVICVLHMKARSSFELGGWIFKRPSLKVLEAVEKTFPVAGHIYFAPPGYHLYIESDTSFSLSVEDLVNWSRPSIDVLFESASDAYGNALIGVILTGANNDGAKGLRYIKEQGGLALVEDPQKAEYPSMPQAALEMTKADYVLSAEDIGKTLASLATGKGRLNG